MARQAAGWQRRARPGVHPSPDGHEWRKGKHAAPVVDISSVRLSSASTYKKGDMEARRLAYNTALFKLAENNPRVIANIGNSKIVSIFNFIPFLCANVSFFLSLNFLRIT